MIRENAAAGLSNRHSFWRTSSQCRVATASGASPFKDSSRAPSIVEARFRVSLEPSAPSASSAHGGGGAGLPACAPGAMGTQLDVACLDVWLAAGFSRGFWYCAICSSRTKLRRRRMSGESVTLCRRNSQWWWRR